MFLRILLKNQLAPNPTKSGLFAALNLPSTARFFQAFFNSFPGQLKLPGAVLAASQSRGRASHWRSSRESLSRSLEREAEPNASSD
jgi:hypothetical protein